MKRKVSLLLSVIFFVVISSTFVFAQENLAKDRMIANAIGTSAASNLYSFIVTSALSNLFLFQYGLVTLPPVYAKKVADKQHLIIMLKEYNRLNEAMKTRLNGLVAEGLLNKKDKDFWYYERILETNDVISGFISEFYEYVTTDNRKHLEKAALFQKRINQQMKKLGSINK